MKEKRVESPSAPIEEIHAQIGRDFYALGDIFPQKNLFPPDLILFNSPPDDDYKERLKGLEIYLKTSKSISALFELNLSTNEVPLGTYVRPAHTIVFDRYKFLQNLDVAPIFKEAYTHETTHAVFDLDKPNIKISSLELQEVDTSLGKLLNPELRYKISLSEFFPPLAQAYLLGTDFELAARFWAPYIGYLWKIDPQLKIPEHVACLKDIIEHLPELAGDLLVKQYKNDVAALVREHPRLFELDAAGLWEEYCVPLLNSGRV